MLVEPASDGTIGTIEQETITDAHEDTLGEEVVPEPMREAGENERQDVEETTGDHERACTKPIKCRSENATQEKRKAGLDASNPADVGNALILPGQGIVGLECAPGVEHAVTGRKTSEDDEPGTYSAVRDLASLIVALAGTLVVLDRKRFERNVVRGSFASVVGVALIHDLLGGLRSVLDLAGLIHGRGL